MTWTRFLRRCRCRSYHRRTGLHVPDCPRAGGIVSDRCYLDGCCWHYSHTLTLNPPIAVRVCCWCGDSRQDTTQVKPTKEHGTRALATYDFRGLPMDNGMTDAELALGCPGEKDDGRVSRDD